MFDLSTNAPAVVKRLHAMLEEKGVALLDAPVTGGVVRATDGTLVIMVGGDEAVFEQHRSILAPSAGSWCMSGRSAAPPSPS